MSIASEILNGEICGLCMIPFTEEHGYGVLCKECWKDEHGNHEFKDEVDEEGFQKAIYELVKPENK